MDIKKIILEEVNDFDWVSDIVDIHVGMCIVFPWGTEGESKNWVVSGIEGSDITLTSIDKGVEQVWGIQMVRDKLRNGSFKLCDDTLTESNFDWTDESEARLVKGMVICNKHGRRFKIYNVFLDTSRSEGYVEFYVDTAKSGNGLFTKPLYYVMNGLELGSLTICKDNSIRESNDFDWVRSVTPIPIGTKITNVNGLPYSLSLGVEPDSVISGWNKGIVRVEEYMDEVVRVTLIGYNDPMYVLHSDLKGYLEGHLGSIVEVEKDLVKESNLGWVQDWMDDTPTVGSRYYFDYGMGDDPILIRVVDVTNYGIKFKVLDTDFAHNHPEMFYYKGEWDYTDSVGLEGFMDYTKKK